MKVETLKDIHTVAFDEIKDMLGENIEYGLCYGSYNQQDLFKPKYLFKTLKGKGGMLDKKPDYILIVNDLKKSIKQINEAKIGKIGLEDKLIRHRVDSPLYFNLETEEDKKVEFFSKYSTIGYKIGLLQKDEILKSKSMFKSIYLQSRLIKPFNEVFAKDDVKEIMSKYINDAKLKMMQLAYQIFYLRDLDNDEIRAENLVENYVKLSYIAESYRVFDLIGKKPTKILNANFYNMKTDEFNPIKDILIEDLDKMLEKNENNLPWHLPISVPLKFAFYNFDNSLISVKNGWTMFEAGGNPMNYVARKFRNIF